MVTLNIYLKSNKKISLTCEDSFAYLTKKSITKHRFWHNNWLTIEDDDWKCDVNKHEVCCVEIIPKK